MSLPPLLRYVYNHGTEEVIRRGKKIFYNGGVQLLDVDHLAEQVRFRVRNDLYQNYYTVTVNKYLQPKELSVLCQCPYNLGEICRHEVAALFHLNDIVQSGFFENTDVAYEQKHTIVRMRHVSESTLRVFTDPQMFDTAEQWAKEKKAIITTKLSPSQPDKNDTIAAEVPDGNKTYHVIIHQNEEKYFDTSCGCTETKYPLCVHKATLFLQVLKKHGAEYFRSMQNWDVQKNKLLEQYGYSLRDNIAGKFTFTYENGKPFLRVLDSSIKKIAGNIVEPVQNQNNRVQTVVAEDEKRLGIVLDTSTSSFPFVNLSLVAGDADDEDKKFVGGIDKLVLNQYINPMRYREYERELIPIIRKFLPDEIVKYLKKNLPFGDSLYDYENILKDMPDEDVREQVWEYLLPKYRKLLERFSSHSFCFIHPQGKAFSSAGLQQVEFIDKPAHPQLKVEKQKDNYIISLNWETITGVLPYKDVTMLNSALLLHDNKVFCVNNLNELRLAEMFMPDGTMKISSGKWQSFLAEKLIPWSHQMYIDFPEEIIKHVEKQPPVYKLLLREREQALIMQPVFSYNGMDVKWGASTDIMLPQDGVITIIQRDSNAEKEFINLIRNLHTDILVNTKDNFFYLSDHAVLSGNWFFRFVELMKEWKVELLGMEQLTNLRINTYKPNTKIQVGNVTDWFEASVEVTFGEQAASISDIKNALADKQNFVRLGDGSMGLLPEEWLKKYALLIKMGETRGSKVKLKKYHFSILDELLADMDEDELQQELEHKKEKLNDILSSNYKSALPPEHLKDILRPYQVAGFQWLSFLNEAGWGGILADDMGLGKTVQTLAFFQHRKETNPDAKFLVVCPTTLIYNWEHEIDKFTPSLKHIIHHGPKRNLTNVAYGPYDIIITTYGTMRSDIKGLHDIPFDYVVLDESQFIKNPQSQVARASLLLNCKNRLALSGTPVQNNTFDLYAQMNFLNPGMLGSREFFMNEFATPIDKFREDEVKQQLKKLTYPFLLRRTKEQVAKDLPDKTETILYCEMGPEQRKIYETYRNAYRSQILGMIEERGMDRSRLHILQGLTKLRQICDSPAILNEEEKFQNFSVKLEELTREITENVGDHKVLVFSQFLGMLGLIREQLREQNINFVYFDGSSTSIQREEAIQEFQNNHDCRVFLISLKAGGVGLNLTAADYVYIVDPWWNPAVEQQAIDRTHRIGQTKNIFAYRLICKDTLEEKMLQLQEQKRTLAAELVSDDNVFLKRLTIDDVAFLFS